MKIGELNTIDGFELMKKLVPAAAKIIENAELSNARTFLKVNGSGAELASKITPVLLSDHMEDVLELVSVIQGITAEEVKKQPLAETIETLSEGVKLFAGFFTASLHLVASA